jgi:hypothetical protein
MFKFSIVTRQKKDFSLKIFFRPEFKKLMKIQEITKFYYLDDKGQLPLATPITFGIAGATTGE